MNVVEYASSEDHQHGQTSIATDSYDDTGKPLAICFFDVQHDEPINIVCLAVSSTHGLVLEYLAMQDVYRRVGLFAYSDPTWMFNCPVSTITIV